MTLGTAWVGLACALIASGCGSVQGHRDRPYAVLGDTVRVSVLGTTIVVPAPEGMADVTAVAGWAPMAAKHGDIVWGIQPRERVERALRPGCHTDLHVMLFVPHENPGSVPANTSTFAAFAQSWRDAASRSMSPEGARVAQALDRWRSGVREGALGLGDPRGGDRFIVAVETPEPGVCRLLTVGRSPASEGGPGTTGAKRGSSCVAASLASTGTARRRPASEILRRSARARSDGPTPCGWRIPRCAPESASPASWIRTGSAVGFGRWARSGGRRGLLPEPAPMP